MKNLKHCSKKEKYGKMKENKIHIVLLDYYFLFILTRNNISAVQ